ncbi:MAG: DNA/RNA non-specific endonuclease [Archangium sp.]|nr:DNA/RNA non-specific endonuclease [Archangium sp.]
MTAAFADRVRVCLVASLVMLGACGSSVDIEEEARPGASRSNREQLISPSMMGDEPASLQVPWARSSLKRASTRFDPIVKPPRRDAGVAEVDAGVAEVDAGVAEVDAGSSEVDAGVDAGWVHTGPFGAEISPHLGLGIPDDSSVGRADKWLLVRSQLVVSYDTTRKIPNWSAWKLESANFGSASRATSFRVDPLLGTAPQARDSDYVGSGFDRGHLCPSADRTASDADNDATFFLTNVVPQTHASNAGPWLDLEDEARQLANAGKKLLIIAGPVFAANPSSIGTGVPVPSATWKVVIVTNGDASPATLNPSTTIVYATVVPNTSVVSGSWRQWQTTVDAVEAMTGLDFLSDVDPDVQSALESRIDQ